MGYFKKILTGLVIAALFVIASYEEAQALKAKGAAPRKSRAHPAWAYDIEDVIRAEGDPEFQEYMLKRSANQVRDEKAIELLKEQQAKYEMLQERAREEYVNQRDKQKPKNELEGYDEHREAQYKIWLEKERSRESFIAERDHRTIRLELAREERLQKSFPKDRLPASIVEPKYPHKYFKHQTEDSSSH